MGVVGAVPKDNKQRSLEIKKFEKRIQKQKQMDTHTHSCGIKTE